MGAYAILWSVLTNKMGSMCHVSPLIVMKHMLIETAVKENSAKKSSAIGNFSPYNVIVVISPFKNSCWDLNGCFHSKIMLTSSNNFFYVLISFLSKFSFAWNPFV